MWLVERGFHSADDLSIAVGDEMRFRPKSRIVSEVRTIRRPVTASTRPPRAVLSASQWADYDLVGGAFVLRKLVSAQMMGLSSPMAPADRGRPASARTAGLR